MGKVFVSREKELKQLASLHKKGSASLVVLRGRRRIGKSRLVEEYAKGMKFLSFAGIPPVGGVNAQAQRDVFSEQLGKQMGIGEIIGKDWSSLFSILARETSHGQVVILLDEISWMGSKDPLFLGKLKNAWDLELKKNPNLLLVLCGSVSTWIEKNIISSIAFFGRISLFLELDELPLAASHELLLTKGFKQSVFEEFKIFGLTGGIPWYLEQIQPGINANDNIRNLCFQKQGALFQEFEAIFHDIFEKRSEIYRPIVESLAKGSMEYKEICKALGYSRSGTLSEYLNDLICSGFISRDYTWCIKSGKTSRISQYRLSDNYLRFYLRYVLPNRDRILRDGFETQSISLLPGWNSIMSLQFENLVLKNRRKIWEALGIKVEDILSDNPFFQRPTKNRKGYQIDYLIQTRFNTLFACEIKFSTHPIKASVISEVRQKLSHITLPKRFSIWPVLIHVNGLSDSLSDSDYFSHIIDFSSMLSQNEKPLDLARY